MFSVLFGLLRRKRNSFHNGRTFFGFLKTTLSFGDRDLIETGGAGGPIGSGSLTGLALEEYGELLGANTPVLHTLFGLSVSKESHNA
jgi:hypothetical protein